MVMSLWLTVVGIVVGAVIGLAQIAGAGKARTDTPADTAGQPQTSTPPPTPTDWVPNGSQETYLNIPEWDPVACPAFVVDFDVARGDEWKGGVRALADTVSDRGSDLIWTLCPDGFLTVTGRGELSWSAGGLADTATPEACDVLAGRNRQDGWTFDGGDSHPSAGEVLCIRTDDGKIARVAVDDVQSDPLAVGVAMDVWSPGATDHP
ncbi:hypothetical protein LX16_2578 [Stackebrandtia albiflava]|uniref:Uncharacterized protein n=1 Tax=Stackebrandtia albiflava TaxID=406432 RepID=A0A562V1W1_9ACTN|nr:hypothetical protein [Stackebrandtia albiflava]TWJ11841.1 hypothetical protein LX16_2578 [Stackebrandtia albiflava]